VAAVAFSVAAGVAGVVFGDLASSEIRGRLDRIPFRLIDRAARRLDEQSRAQSAAEWTAELDAVLRHRGTDGIPLARLAVGIRFALGIVRAARTIGRDRHAVRTPDDPAPDPAGLLSAWTDVARTATRLRSASPPLVTDLLDAELTRMSTLVNQLHAGSVTYDGEDQDWLLALARSTKSSLDATSLCAADHNHRYDATFWTSDLGRRYLQTQQQIIAGGVRIRRLFILDHPELATDPGFINLCRQQTQLGIHTRTLATAAVPPQRAGDLVDFILFDQVLSYETLNPTHVWNGQPRPAIHTRLHLDPTRIANRTQLFHDLWHAATVTPTPEH
jgi:hypothetical protein